MKRLAAVCLLVLLMVLPSLAEEDIDIDRLYAEQWEASGADDLWQELPQETVDLLRRWGIDDLSGIEDALSSGPQSVLENLWSLFSREATGPLAAGGVVIGLVLLCALLEGFRQGATPSGTGTVFSAVGAVGSYAAVALPLTVCVQRVCAAVESSGIFMTGYVPVYAGILLANGQAATAASYQTVTLFAAQLLTWLTGAVVLPCLVISLTFGLTGAVAPELRLSSVAGTVNKAAGWLMGISATLFAGLLSLRGVVSAAADSLGGRAVRFSLASWVPVVGGALGEAFNAIRGCLSMLRASVGVIGVAATVLIVLPPLLECVGWTVGLGLCGMAAEMFSLPLLSGLLRAAQSVVRTMIAVLLCCALFLIVGTTVVIVAAGLAG